MKRTCIIQIVMMEIGTSQACLPKPFSVSKESLVNCNTVEKMLEAD